MTFSSKPLVVIAIGGNSLISDSRHMSVSDQYRAAGETSHHIAALVTEGYRVLITHGNGPQVGFILLRSEIAKDVLHQVPLDSCVADTQGAIGYQISQTLGNELRRLNIDKPIVGVVSQVVVDAKDPAFANPTKPIGPFMTEADAIEHRSRAGWAVKEDAGRGWRRVVPSPRPVEIVEEHVIRTLLEQDIIVTAVGGGGVPVIRRVNGDLEGCAAVIDKDLASCLLAARLGADLFVISTSVDKVSLFYGTAREQPIDRISVGEARMYMKEGHFSAGSMQPKIQAAIDYLESGGKHVIITQPHLLEEAVQGKTGTHIVP